MDRAPLGSYFAMAGLPAPHARGSALNRENLSEAADAYPHPPLKLIAIASVLNFPDRRTAPAIPVSPWRALGNGYRYRAVADAGSASPA